MAQWQADLSKHYSTEVRPPSLALRVSGCGKVPIVASLGVFPFISPPTILSPRSRLPYLSGPPFPHIVYVLAAKHFGTSNAGATFLRSVTPPRGWVGRWMGPAGPTPSHLGGGVPSVPFGCSRRPESFFGVLFWLNFCDQYY